MPRPPVLPELDWSKIFASGQDWSAWIESAEKAEHRDKMQSALADMNLMPQAEAWLKALPRTVNVIAIAEDWCGDVVRHVPPLVKICQASGKVNLRFITREQHPDVFVRFLTNGGEAIPKFIFLSDNWVECGNWGPMPAECRRIIARGKASGKAKEARERVSKLYESDPHLEVVLHELLEILVTATSHNP